MIEHQAVPFIDYESLDFFFQTDSSIFQDKWSPHCVCLIRGNFLVEERQAEYISGWTNQEDREHKVTKFYSSFISQKLLLRGLLAFQRMRKKEMSTSPNFGCQTKHIFLKTCDHHLVAGFSFLKSLLLLTISKTQKLTKNCQDFCSSSTQVHTSFLFTADCYQLELPCIFFRIQQAAKYQNESR